MATHDYVIANASGAAVRADLNNALAAIVTNNSNAVEPATTYAFQWWADTTAGQLKLRNAANDGWVVIQELDGTMLMENGSAASPGLAFADDLDTGIFRPDADALAIATNGVERVEFGTSEVVFNDGGENIDFRVEGTTRTELLFVDASADIVKIGDELRVANFISHIGDLNTKFGFPDNDTITFDTDNVERLRINSSGQILVGTSSTSATAVAVLQGASGDPCNIYLQRPTTTPTDGNSLGQIFFADSAGGAGARVLAQRDGGTWTSGSSHPGRLVFSTTADGESSPTEQMRINKNGQILFGITTAPAAGTGGSAFIPSSNQRMILDLSTNSTATNSMARFYNQNGEVGSIRTSGSSTVYQTSSDYRLKENVVKIDDGIERLKQLQPKRFNFIADPSVVLDGFLAHETQTVVPEAISGERDEIDDDGKPTANFWWNYEQDEYTDWNDKYWIENGAMKMSPDPWRPVWSIMAFTRDNSNNGIRARKLAWKVTDKAKRDPYNAYDVDTFTQHEKDFLVTRNLDFSFEYDWKGEGKWTI